MSALTRLIEDLPSLIGEIKRSEINADLQKYMIDKEHEMKLDALRYESALENKNIYLEKADSVEQQLLDTGISASSLSEVERTAGIIDILDNINPANTYRDFAANEEKKAEYHRQKYNVLSDNLRDLNKMSVFMTGAGGYEAGDPAAYDAEDFSTDRYMEFAGKETLSPVEQEYYGLQNIPSTLMQLNKELITSRGQELAFITGVKEQAGTFLRKANNEYAAIIGQFAGEENQAIMDEQLDAISEQYGLNAEQVTQYKNIISKLNQTSDPQAFMDYINHPDTQDIIRATYATISPIAFSNMENQLNSANVYLNQLPADVKTKVDTTDKNVDQMLGNFETAISILPNTPAGYEEAFDLYVKYDDQGIFANDVEGKKQQEFFGKIDSHFGRDMGPDYETYINTQLEIGKEKLTGIEERKQIFNQYKNAEGLVDEAKIYNAISALTPLSERDYDMTVPSDAAQRIKWDSSYVGHATNPAVRLANEIKQEQLQAFDDDLGASYKNIIAYDNADGLFPDWVHHGRVTWGNQVDLLYSSFKDNYPEYLDEAMVSAENEYHKVGRDRIKEILTKGKGTEYWRLIKALEGVEKLSAKEKVESLNSDLLEQQWVNYVQQTGDDISFAEFKRVGLYEAE